MTSYANVNDDPGYELFGGSDDIVPIVPNLDQFADLYRGLDTGQLNDLYLNFAEQYKNVFTPEQIQQVGSALFGGNLEEDFVVDDKGRIISTGGATDAGARMPGSGESNITQRGGASGSKGTNPLARLLSGQGGMSDLLGTGLAALMAKKAYDEGEARRRAAAGAKFESRGPVTATRTAFKGTKYSAAGGGIGSLDMAKGGRTLPPRYLDGHSDGMADKIPANIDGKQPAALSDGEFVIPADVVSHLGNGNSNAGAKRLYKMMDDIRAARTGNPKQGKQINPDKFMPR